MLLDRPRVYDLPDPRSPRLKPGISGKLFFLREQPVGISLFWDCQNLMGIFSRTHRLS